MSTGERRTLGGHASSQPGSTIKTTKRDGVSLAYLDTGRGSPPMVFVHAWGCDHTSFTPQIEHFARSHRVIAPDLRGHGASDKPEQTYSPSALADDIAWLCRELAVDRPVVVGQSLGGLVATVLAAEHPDVPAAVAALTAPLLPPPQMREGVGKLVEAIRTPAYREVVRHFLEQGLFLPTDPPDVRERIVDQITSTPQHVLASALEGAATHNGAATLGRCRVPLLYINDALPMVDIPALRQAYPSVVIGQAVGTGHFPQLIVPDQVNAMLERFMTLAVLPPGAPSVASVSAAAH